MRRRPMQRENIPHRYTDAVEIVDGNIVGIHQAGKVNNNGTHVIRESRTIEDIMNSSEGRGDLLLSSGRITQYSTYHR